MEKSARIGKTLTWMVGFLIIVFTLVLLVIASVLLSGSKRVSDGWDSIEFKEYGLKDLEKQNDIIYILNSEVDFNGEDIKFFNAITFSLDELSEIKNNEDKSVIEVFNLEKINSLFDNNLEKTLLEKGFDEDAVEKVGMVVDNFREGEFVNSVTDVLDENCGNYIFGFPFGVIDNTGNSPKTVELYDEIFDREVENWDESAEFTFFYNEHYFKIKYRKLKECK